MCGIAGLFHYRTQLPASAEALERMTARLVHRGPDDAGSFLDREVALGHRRLSIIDLSAAGHQPMTNEDGSVVVTYNGEIYNFAELRAELLKSGHVFRSSSDTEVLVHLWEERRTAMVDRLVGMFAFALFDRRTRELFLARDRCGEKPLFWAPIADGVAFASEIKALAEDPRVDCAVERGHIATYLSRMYIPAPATIYRGVRALEPATYGLFRANREPEFVSYWSPRPRADLPRSRPERRALVDEALRNAVRSCMVADVPVGCFLSSGVDSSLVAFYMQNGNARQIETFSIGFAERGYDESRESTQVANMLGVRHRVEILEPPSFESIESILQQYDQPFGDPSAIPTWLLSRVAGARTKVVLTGDGGDEAFGGYERYRLMLFSNSLSRIGGLRRLGRALLRREAASMSPRRVLGRALIVAASQRVGAYVSLTNPFEADALRTLLPDVAPAGDAREAESFAALRDVSLAAQVADLTTYLPSCLATKVDIASMAHSLETRAPFLDHRLIELGLGLPRRERVWLGRTKVLLRGIARRRLGNAVGNRRKRGFGVPLEIWLRGALRAQATDYLLGPGGRLRTIATERAVADDIRRFFDGDRSMYVRMWTLLALEAWLRGPLGRRAVV